MALGVQFTSGTFLGIDKDDLPVAYGKVYFNHPQTNDVIPTYKNSSLTIVNEHPVVLSASGKANIFLGASHYNIVLTDQDDEVVWSINDYVTVGLGVDLSAWRENQTAALDQTDFVLSNAVNSSTIVYQEGALLTVGVDYNVIPNYVIQLLVPAADGDNLSFFGSAPDVTTSGLTSDGQVPMDNGYTPAVDQDIATKLYVDQHIPAAGTGIDFYGIAAPYGFFPCDGRAIPKADYGELYLAIGDIYATTGGVAAPDASDFRIPPQTLDGFGLFNRGKSPTLAIGTYQADDLKAHNHTGQTVNDTHTHTANHNHTGSSNSTGSHTHTVSALGSSTGNYLLTGGNQATYLTKTTSSAGSHSHTITINTNSFSTGGDTHSHTFTTNNTGYTETRPQSLTVLKCISAGKEII